MYTCNACGIQFELSEAQKSHMKSEWHRYNLKRKVANLPAIEESLFNEKVSNLSIEDGDDMPKPNKKEKQITKKQLRRRQKEELTEKKRQLLESAKQSMLNSLNKISTGDKKPSGQDSHDTVKEAILNQTEVSQGGEQNAEDIPEDQLTEEQLYSKIMAEKLENAVEILPEVCLFCNKNFGSLESNCDHMFKSHGFYIPEQNYLVDKPGLVKYMSEKIAIGNLCVVCNFQGRSLEAVRAHMLAKRHCRVPYESEDEKLEISEFYDFTSTYNDFGTTDVGDDDEGWEDLSGDEEVVGDSNDSDDDSVPLQEKLPQYLSYDDGVELHLPTGVKVGHRSLVRYYKQNLKPESVLSEGQGTVIAAESRHMISAIDRAVLQEKKRTWRTEKSHCDRDDRRAAKFINNQPHYRDQLLQ